MEPLKIALVPAYEPAPLLLQLLWELKNAGFETVMVNDGSSKEKDGLFLQASEYAVVLKHPENRGKGRALKTGLDYIQSHYPPGYVVVTLDADGQHTVTDALRVWESAREHPGQLILGSRGLKEKVPVRSRLGNTITRFVYRLSTGVGVHDTQTGLRAFDSRLIPPFLEVPGERYEYEMNVLLCCPRQGIPIREVEIQTIYMDNNSSSHFDTLRDSYRIYKEILKFSAVSLTCFLVDYALYSLLLLLPFWRGASGSLAAANVGARAVSAALNYTLNRKLVFQSKNSVRKSAFQYFLLAAAILAGNTLVLAFLAEGLGVNRFAAKLCTELLFFAASWMVQRSLIFRRKDGA